MKRVSTWVKLCFFIVLIGTVMPSCSIKERPYTETLVLTVDDSKIYLDEVMYHVMLAEMQGSLYASFLESGEDYWNIKNKDGITIGEATKDMAMEHAIRYELLYKTAIKNGYTLTEEEKKISMNNADNILKNIPAEQIKITELTKEKLIEIQNKITMVTKYYEDYINNIEVDKEAIKAGFSLEEYRQYDIQYIFVQKEDYGELTALQEQVELVEDITVLTKDRNVTSGKLSFLKGKDIFGEEANLEEVIQSMNIGEVSNIIETVKGYYIIKLMDNTSTDKYDAAVNEEIENIIEDTFLAEYEAMKKEHKISIKQEVWKKIKVGSIMF